MKKLTAGIFTVLVSLVSANSANAAIATQGYVDQEVGKVSGTVSTLTQTVADNKTAAENDATTKANKALADAKEYVEGQLGALTDGKISETQDRVTANEQAIEGLLDSVEAMGEAYKAADTTLQGNIDNLSGTVSAMDAAYKLADTNLENSLKTYADGKASAAQSAAEATASADATAKANKALEDAKKYADEEDKKIEDTIGTVETGKTVVGMIAEAKTAASTGASEALEAYKATNDVAVAAAQSAANTAQSEVDALETVVANNKSATDTAIETITKENGTIDTKVAASAAATKSAYEAADSSLKTELEGKITAASTAASTAESNAKKYTDDEIAALNLNDLSRVPAECAEASKWCVLTSNGTNYYWEVIVRGDANDPQPTGSAIPAAN